MASFTNFPNGITSFGIPVLGNVPFGKDSVAWFVDPANGADGNDGRSPSSAFATLYRAQYAATAGRNDVVFLMADVTTSSGGTARLSLANAVAAWAYAPSGTTQPTTGTLNWDKNAVHLIGVCAPTMFGQRARIAPPTGTYTAATFGSGNFISHTAIGCIVSNIEIFNGFSTGGTNQICYTLSSAATRNYFENVHFYGMADAASAQNTGSRSLKISAGENTFVNCVIGGDTVTRTVANASLELAGGCARNVFKGCIFPFQTSAAGVLGVLGTGASCIDRSTYFEKCTIVNNIKSTSTQMTVFASLTSASPGGLLSFVDCPMIGVTEYGDTNALANSYVNMAAPSASAGGIMVNPS
jgi:hypothetical protein